MQKTGILEKVIVIVFITFMIALLFSLLVSCSDKEATTNGKISSMLLTQINLRKAQVAEPTPHRLEIGW